MRISDWSSDVCSSDLTEQIRHERRARALAEVARRRDELVEHLGAGVADDIRVLEFGEVVFVILVRGSIAARLGGRVGRAHCPDFDRSEEQTSELQSLMRSWYAVCCLKKKTKRQQYTVLKA